MNSYEVKITSCNKDLTARERIKTKDTTNALALDEVVNGDSVIISPEVWAELAIHNERNTNSDETDYNKYVVIDKDGTKYTTSSNSFWYSFIEIAKEMEGEDFEIEVYKVESKNYKGKYFINCSIV